MHEPVETILLADVSLTERSRVRVDWLRFADTPSSLKLTLWTATALGTLVPRHGLLIPADAVATFVDAVSTAVPLAKKAQREADRSRVFKHRRFHTP